MKISKQEYLRALYIVEEYISQLKEKPGKTKIEDSYVYRHASDRLRRALLNNSRRREEGLIYSRRLDPIEYIEDYDRWKVAKLRGVGRKTINEFVRLQREAEGK